MDRWDVLFRQAAQAVEIEQQWLDWQYRARTDPEALTKWSLDAAGKVLDTFHERARDRARALSDQTELSVSVIEPEWSTVTGAVVGVVRLLGPTNPSPREEFGRKSGRNHDEVEVYVHLVPGQMPLVYYLIPADAGWVKRCRHPRWITLPAARLAWGREGAATLVGADGDHCALTVDDLVYRAFELLLERVIQRVVPRDFRPASRPALDLPTPAAVDLRTSH